MKQILAITRSRSDLTVTMLCAEPPDAALLQSPEKAGSLDFPALYLRETCFLDACDAPLRERQRQLGRSWQALQSVATMNADTLFDVCIVLLETVAEPEETSMPLPPLDQNRDAIAPIRKPTAAHPRAYKGTKVQPPKLPVPEAMDLRPYLCHSDSLQLILTRLRQFRRETAIRLQRSGYEAERIQALGMMEEQESAYPALAAIVAAEADTSRLPTDFRRFFLPLLQGREPTRVKAYLALYWKLQLQERENESLLCAFAHLVRLQNGDMTLHWGEVIVCLPVEWRISFACLLAHTQAYRVDPRNLSLTVLKAFEDIDAHPYPVYRLYCLLLGLARNVDGDYLLTGFRLANRYSEGHRFHDVQRSGAYPSEAMEACLAHLQPAFSASYEDTPLLLWEACGVFDGFSRFVTETAWKSFTPAVAKSYAQVYLSIFWQDWTNAQKTACWKWLRQIKPELDTLLSHTSPEYQDKCVWLLKGCVWEWGEQSGAQARMANALPLIARVCRPPFRKHTWGTRIAPLCAQYLNCAAHEMLRLAPDSSFLRLEDTCVRQNGASLVEAGFYTLVRIVPTWTAQVFSRYAAKLCRVARVLGCFSEALRDGVARQFLQGLNDLPDIAALPLGDACAVLETISLPNAAQIVPRQLREHLAQSRILDVTRLAHYRGEMTKRFLLAQLEMLEQIALQSLCDGFPTNAADPKAHHALQMRRHIHDNRRPLRNFLRAYLSGQKDYLLQHPRSQAWLKQHPNLNHDVWLRGIDFPALDIAGIGNARVSVESEPLEVLQMGTYVGSCLGLGGYFAYSAVANMLDINKQVLYARDEAGRVVARQLVAVSEAGQLVCFDVYPYGVDGAMQGLFRDYNRQWAIALNLPIFSYEGNNDYTVANVLSQHWWDDNAWNLEIEEPSSTQKEG